MNSRLVFVFGLLFMAAIAMAEDYEEDMEMEDSETALVETANDYEDPDAIKNKGSCQIGIGKWIKAGLFDRCGCLKCVCKAGGNWACGYEFSWCPYFFCGNGLYNPKTHICCCGKLYAKKSDFKCCGYGYYNGLTSQCCKSFAIRPKKGLCPRAINGKY